MEDGWKDFKGGDHAIDDDTQIEIRLVDGTVSHGLPGDFDWKQHPEDHPQRRSDIIAFREI